MRSLLIIAANRTNLLNAAVQGGADAVICDLAGINGDERNTARREAAAWLCGVRKAGKCPLLGVRIGNAATPDTDDDLAAVMAHGPELVWMPGVTTGAQITRLDAKLNVHEALNGIEEGNTAIIASIYVGASLGRQHVYAAASPRLCALTWARHLHPDGAEISRPMVSLFAGQLFGFRDLARFICLESARAAQVDAMEAPHPFADDTNELRQAARAAARNGFSGMIAVDPKQVPIINAEFARLRRG